jgi:hypothetical protein
VPWRPRADRARPGDQHRRWQALAQAGRGPAELNRRHDRRVRAVAVLPDGRVVTGGHDGHVLVRDPAQDRTKLVQLGCSATALASAPSAKDPAW